MRIRQVADSEFEVIDNNHNKLMIGTFAEAQAYYDANSALEISEEVFVLNGEFVKKDRTPISLSILDGAKGDFSVVGKMTSATLNISAVPTSATGLVAGDVWNDLGTLKIV